MRIGVDARMLGSSFGIGRYIDELVRRILAGDEGNEYVIFLNRETFRSNALTHPRARRVCAPERWYGYAEQVSWPYRLWRERLELLFVPQFNVPLLVPCPFVVTIHDVTQLFMPGSLQYDSFVHRYAFHRVFSHAVQKARAVIAVSEYTKEEIVKNFGVAPERIHVIYEGPGLSPAATETLTPKPETLSKSKIQNPNDRSDLGFRASSLGFPDREYILAVGVWRSHKNFEGLLEAFALLKENPQFSALKLVLAGEQDSRYCGVRERIRALSLQDSVITPGVPSDEELDGLYRGARAVVVPSLYEGFGFVGIEALTRKIPVVAAYAASLPEVLGNAALYCDPHDVSDMARAIARVLSEEGERKRILEAAPAVLTRYCWDRAARETLEVFRTAVK